MRSERVVVGGPESLDVVVRSRLPLRYASPSPGLPEHVRSASGIAWWNGAFHIVQDDAALLARVDSALTHVDAVRVPLDRAGLVVFEERGDTKQWKPDLEGCAVLPSGKLVAIGSGSTRERRRMLIGEHVGGNATFRAFDATALYDRIEGALAPSGAAINLEGIAIRGPRALIVQRGNGAPNFVDAVLEVDVRALDEYLQGGPAPTIEAMARFELPLIGDARISLTDVTVARDTTIFTGCAEATTSTYDDGDVMGAAIIRVTPNGATWGVIRDDEGDIVCAKPEGITIHPATGATILVTDPDDPDIPSELWEISIT